MLEFWLRSREFDTYPLLFHLKGPGFFNFVQWRLQQVTRLQLKKLCCSLTASRSDSIISNVHSTPFWAVFFFYCIVPTFCN